MELEAFLIASLAAFLVGLAAVIFYGSDLATYTAGLLLAISSLIALVVATYEGYVRTPES